MGGVQSQYAPSSYIGLWTRLERFERPQLTKALERRTIVQGTLMRGTIHLVTAGDYWPLAAGIREDSRTWWLGATRHQISEREVAAVARRARSLLADGPRRRKDLVEELGVTSTDVERRRRVAQPPARSAVGDVGAALGRPVCRGGGLADERARRDARRRARVARPTLPRRIRSGIAQGHRELGRDLGDDARAGARADAVAAVPRRARRRAVRSLRGRPLPGADAPAPVRFLPTWDATLLVHARRTQILPERFRPMLFDTKTPHSSPSFLVDGQVAGTWRHVGATRRGVAVRAVAASRAAGRRRRGATARGVARVIVRSRGGRRSARRPPAA